MGSNNYSSDIIIVILYVALVRPRVSKYQFFCDFYVHAPGAIVHTYIIIYACYGQYGVHYCSVSPGAPTGSKMSEDNR